MKLIITNIEPEKIKEVYDGIKILHDITYYFELSKEYNKPIYIRINDSKMSYSNMSYLHDMDNGNKTDMFYNESFERIDYEEWYKENEVSITAIKFGLL